MPGLSYPVKGRISYLLASSLNYLIVREWITNIDLYNLKTAAHTCMYEWTIMVILHQRQNFHIPSNHNEHNTTFVSGSCSAANLQVNINQIERN